MFEPLAFLADFPHLGFELLLILKPLEIEFLWFVVWALALGLHYFAFILAFIVLKDAGLVLLACVDRLHLVLYKLYFLLLAARFAALTPKFIFFGQGLVFTVESFKCQLSA